MILGPLSGWDWTAFRPPKVVPKSTICRILKPKGFKLFDIRNRRQKIIKKLKKKKNERFWCFEEPLIRN